MVAVAAPAKVLVSGANGYLAVWVVEKYLEAGYSVRGTVRSLTKSAFLKDTFAKYADRFELVAVEDITKEGAFDEAVKGVDVVVHTASPFHLNAVEPDELIVPAIRGTVSILTSVLKCGTSVKRVVLTSSIVAVFEVPSNPTPRIFDEQSWNNLAVRVVKEKGNQSSSFTIYQASKTLAERAAWDFVAEHKNEISWDLVALNPPWIFGLSRTPAPTVDDVNTSQREVYDTLVGARTGAQLKVQSNWVHVQVIAEAHVRATSSATTGGERIIVRSGPFFYQGLCTLVDAAAELGLSGIHRGDPEAIKGAPILISYATTKAEELLGLTQVTPLKDMVSESVEDFKARGYPGFTA
ncbi:D-lactaldehyde dehydrogenase [Gloeopeniophorella convolvens]|nr:D-lactaldehyde dehydrogenase [Gloeopeniophorella convolvens]